MDNEKMLERIKELVASQGITIAELERRAGVSNATIARWGKAVPTADKLQKVAQLLGTTMDYLINGTNESEASSIVLARGMSTLTPEQLETVKSIIEQFNKTNEIK